ncbi:putative StAR-related lipid transfer protein 5 [Hypsibius exemplaris]|uniref:StAR-related lipid transfer protein 5 n=1 Tax=Hypsibius exemplaris TaxID=2072580 RepID=A0A9X6NJ48_HYPEX|nr:putative StAR-related lipid transfer protein 5 [Hypsibius exemplaris]
MTAATSEERLLELTPTIEYVYGRVLELENLKYGWKHVKETSDCTVHSRPSKDFEGFIFKSDGLIPAPPEVVFDLVAPGAGKPGRGRWDTSVHSSEVIEQLSTDIDIRLTRTLPVFMSLISAREFVDVVKVTREDDRIFTACVSIEHPDYGAKSSKGIRGTCYPNGLFCYRVQGNANATRLIQYIHSDLGGMLPQSLIDSATPSVMASNYKQLKAFLKKEKF